jgi:hypothetical protein
VDEIQIRQQVKSIVSGYHVQCSAKLLKLETKVVQEAFTLLGVPVWPKNADIIDGPVIPDSKSELLSVLLQASPHLSPLFQSSHPAWSRWLNRLSHRQKAIIPYNDPSVIALTKAMSKLFTDTDLCIDLCHSELVANGFSRPSPQSHLQIARQVSKGIPDLLLIASITMKFPEMLTSKDD